MPEIIKTPKRRWTLQEDQYVQKNFVVMGCKPIADELKRTAHSVFHRAKALGLQKEWRWGEEQISFLKVSGHLCAREIGEQLGFTADQVQRKAYALKVPLARDSTALGGGATKWTTEEEELLKINYRSTSLRDLATQLGKREATIIAKARRMGLATAGPENWTPAQLAVLHAQYSKLPLEKLAVHLGRSEKGTRIKLAELGLQQSNYRENTKPERIVEDLLQELELPYQKQFRFSAEGTNIKRGFYKIDFVVGHFAIEVLGDYFHCNPLFYPNGPIDKLQESSLARDQERRDKLRQARYNQLELWQHTVENNREFVHYLLSTLAKAPMGETPWFITA